MIVGVRPIHQPPASSSSIARRPSPSAVVLRQVRIFDAKKMELRLARGHRRIVVLPLLESSTLGESRERDQQQRPQRRDRIRATAFHRLPSFEAPRSSRTCVRHLFHIVAPGRSNAATTYLQAHVGLRADVRSSYILARKWMPCFAPHDVRWFRLPNAGTCSNIGDAVAARACGARSKTHSPLISSRLMQRRACPAPTVGVGHARLFVTTRAKSSFGNVAWFSSHFGGPQAHGDRLKLPHNSAEFLSHSLGGRGVHRFDAEDKLEVAVFGILCVNPHLQNLGISQRSGF